MVVIAENLTSGGMGEVALPALVHAHRGAGGYGALLASWAFITAGCATSLGGVLFYTMAQRSLPPAMLGRVLSMIMLCSYGTFPLSVAVTGVLVRHVGTTPFFPIAGIFLVLSVKAVSLDGGREASTMEGRRRAGALPGRWR